MAPLIHTLLQHLDIVKVSTSRTTWQTVCVWSLTVGRKFQGAVHIPVRVNARAP